MTKRIEASLNFEEKRITDYLKHLKGLQLDLDNALKNNDMERIIVLCEDIQKTGKTISFIVNKIKFYNKQKGR